jgi:hypothetical protein
MASARAICLASAAVEANDPPPSRERHSPMLFLSVHTALVTVAHRVQRLVQLRERRAVLLRHRAEVKHSSRGVSSGVLLTVAGRNSFKFGLVKV